jgi:hypothetical protein
MKNKVFLKACLVEVVCMLCCFLLLGSGLFAQQTKHVHEVQVIKFDNYDNAAGEQTVFKHVYIDSIEFAPAFDIAFAVKQFNFPTANDTLTKLLAGKTTPQYMPAKRDSRKRLVQYFPSAKEHYDFEYNSFGNLQYIKRWGVKHVTAQMTFIYIY